MDAMELGYKSPGPGSPNAFSSPRRHFVAVHCTPKPEKGDEEGREREEGEGGAIGTPPKLPEQETTPRRCTTLHCFQSYMAMTRYCTAILSPTTPTVSPGLSPAHR